MVARAVSWAFHRGRSVLKTSAVKTRSALFADPDTKSMVQHTPAKGGKAKQQVRTETETHNVVYELDQKGNASGAKIINLSDEHCIRAAESYQAECKRKYEFYSQWLKAAKSKCPEWRIL